MRDASGEGQEVSVSLMHIGFYIQGNDARSALAAGEAPPRHDRRAPRNPLWNHYQVKDDRWIFLVMIESDRYWPRFCGGHRSAWNSFKRRALRRRRRPLQEHHGTLVEILEQTSSRVERSMNGATILDQPWPDLGAHQHDRRGDSRRGRREPPGVFQTVEHPTAGTYETISPPVSLSAFEMKGERPAPVLGADGAEILREVGLSDEEVKSILG